MPQSAQQFDKIQVELSASHLNRPIDQELPLESTSNMIGPIRRDDEIVGGQREGAPSALLTSPNADSFHLESNDVSVRAIEDENKNKVTELNAAAVKVDVRSSLIGSARKDNAPIQWPSMVSSDPPEEEKHDDNRPLPSSSTHVEALQSSP